MNTNELLSQLRKFVLIKSGLRNIDPAHCKTISELIFKETKNYVSETTVKRFFGFAQTVHKFSLFTLNSLSQYIGFVDWESFCKDKENETADVNDIWQDLKLKCQAITEISLIAKKNSSGVPFDATANRSFLYADFNYFLKNNYQFTTISAQPGQGKSILLAHLVEHFFYGEDAIYKKDIVLLINAGTINDIIQNGLTLKDWFYKELKFAGVSELIAHFKKDQKNAKGRFILIIDGIDQFLSNIKFFKTFTHFLFSIEESDFVKIVLGLRVNNWVNLQPAITGSAFLTKVWYKGLFFDDDKNTNVPPLNKEEILFTLSCIEGKVVKEDEVHHSLLEQFRTPFWLQIYYKLKQENSSHKLINPILCYELINYFLENKIFLSKNSTEKTFILKEVSGSISKGNICHRVAKENILSYIKNYQESYQELIYSGILIEEKRLTTSIPTEIIRFLNNDIYTYFLFLQLTEKFQFKPNKAFFEEILTSYSNQPDLRNYMLNWSIRFCVNRNEIKTLSYIFQLPFSNTEKNKAFDFICDVALFELSKASSNFNAQTIDMNFIDLMVMSRLMSKNYKECIKKISEKVFDEDIQIMLNIIESSINVIDIDKAGLTESMQLLKRNGKKLAELFPINPYDFILFFSNLLQNKPSNSKILNEKIDNLCEQVNNSGVYRNIEITSAEIICYRLVLIVLFADKNYKGCLKFLTAILKKYPGLFYLRSSIFPPFLLVMLAQTYIKLNQNKKAQRIIQYLEKAIDNEKIYYSSYIEGVYILAKANFLNHTGNYPNALLEITRGITLAQDHKFNTLEISFRLMEIDALKSNNEIEKVNQAIKSLLNFLVLHKLSMPSFTNINNEDFDHTFNILRSYK